VCSGRGQKVGGRGGKKGDPKGGKGAVKKVNTGVLKHTFFCFF
jgi:hypothetical protein